MSKNAKVLLRQIEIVIEIKKINKKKKKIHSMKIY